MWSGAVQTAPLPAVHLPTPVAPGQYAAAAAVEPVQIPAPMPKPAEIGVKLPDGRAASNIIINTGTPDNPNPRMINIPLISAKPPPKPEDMFGPAPPPGHREPAPAPEADASDPAAQDSQGTKLFLGGLNYDTEEQGLRAYFGKWGTVVDCLVLRDKDTEKSRGFGFVTLVEEEARAAPMPPPPPHGAPRPPPSLSRRACRSPARRLLRMCAR